MNMQSNNKSSTTNQKIIKNKKGFISCYYCKSKKIVYDEYRDEIYCNNCGTILKQGLFDYETLIIEILFKKKIR